MNLSHIVHEHVNLSLIDHIYMNLSNEANEHMKEHLTGIFHDHQKI